MPHIIRMLLIRCYKIYHERGLVALVLGAFRNIALYPILRLTDYFSGLLFLGKERTIQFPIEEVSLLVSPNNSWTLTALNPRFVQDARALHFRVTSEPLLREIVNVILKSSHFSDDLNARRDVIDIGCWIGDNAAVWAKILPREGVVFAIDPDPQNVGFLRSVAVANGLDEKVVAIEAVCSDRPGKKVFFEGSISHAKFSTDSNKRPAPLLTETLDRLVGGHPRYTHVGLIHVDVEDMEYEVLQGALGILSNDKPLVIFEQHLGRLDNRIGAFLYSLNYRIFMINEVIKENSPDCRNFLAVNCQTSDTLISTIENCSSRTCSQYFPATLGGKLIIV